MKHMSKQLDKDLSMVFFNSVEEMNECYCINAELPSNLHSNSDLVCYEIVEQFTYEEVCQYKFEEGGLKFFSFGRWYSNLRSIDNEILLNKHDFDNYDGRCFVYVRVNDYLRKHLEKTLIGCEFIYKKNLKNTLSKDLSTLLIILVMELLYEIKMSVANLLIKFCYIQMIIATLSLIKNGLRKLMGKVWMVKV